MATAPDPVAMGAELAAEKADQARREAREWRDAIVLWLYRGDERRTLRMSEQSARQVGRLKRAGVNVDQLWTDLLLPTGQGDLETFAAAWWLAGMQQGLEEQLDDLLDLTYTEAPWVYAPTAEERDTDRGGAALDPPA